MPPVRRKRVSWAPKDLKALRRVAGRQSVKRIAGMLKRTVLAVRFKAHMKGISLAYKRSR
jgi:hypothetical protein